MYTNVYRRAHGDGSLDNGGGFLNMELPLIGNSSFYAFGGVNYKASDAYAFTRNWSARPDRFPTDAEWQLFMYQVSCVLPVMRIILQSAYSN